MNTERSFEYYNLYKSINLHFKSKSYDYFKYNGRSRSNQNNISSYNKFITSNKNLKSFEALSNMKMEDARDLIISNLCDEDVFIVDIVSQKGKDRYKNWKLRKNNFTYTFKDQLSTFINIKGTKALFDVDLVLTHFLQKKFTVEVAAVIVYRFHLKNTTSNPLFKDLQLRLIKYHSFLEYDKNYLFNVVKGLIK